MLKSVDILERMLAHFPRWMDIRKRVRKSDGGKLLISMTEEITEVQSAIDEYRQDFFVDHYIGKGDTIVDFIYHVRIGNVDKAKLTVLRPAIPLAETIEEFYSGSGKAYYDQGELFFREEDIIPLISDPTIEPRIEYSIDVYKTSDNVARMHVWNVFDEFAVFIGIQRHDGESNEELLNRILNTNKGPVNSTEEGLKNAIIAELANIDPDLEPDEILIERPTPENLSRYYRDFETIIDKMSEVNRDVYRTKRWDIDTWGHNFVSIDYLPHAWDVVLEAYTNGVGVGDDLKVELVSPNSTTNADIEFYGESETLVREYVRNRNIQKPVGLKLKRYNNKLKPVDVEYKITASDVSDLSQSEIKLQCSERVYGQERRYLQHIVSETKDIEVLDNSALEKGFKYELKFEPQSDYGPMEIQKCDLISGETRDSLLTAGGQFVINPINGVLYNNALKLYVTQKQQFSSTSNIKSTYNGITIENLQETSAATLDLNNLASQPIKVEYGCDLSHVSNELIKRTGFTINGEDEFVSSKTGDTIEIELSANYIEFEIMGGSMHVSLSVDGQELDNNWYSTKVISQRYNTVRVFKVKITSVGQGTKVKNIKYNAFEFIAKINNGGTRTDLGETLPNSSTLKLEISMKAYTEKSPYIRFVHVGNKNTGVSYTANIINLLAATGSSALDIKTNCKITLVCKNESDTVVSEIKDYKPYSLYKALTDSAYVKIDLSQYSSVESVMPTYGRVMRSSTTSDIVYYLFLTTGQQVTDLIVTGERLAVKKEYTLQEMLSAEATDKIYANSLLKSFVLEKANGDQSSAELAADLFNGLGVESFKFLNVPSDISCAFVLNKQTGSSTVSDSYTGSFESIYLFPRYSQKYIAFNKTRTIMKEVSDIEIVDNFDRLFPINSNMIYMVEPMDPSKGSAKFDKDGVDFVNLSNWSVGKKTLRVKANIEPFESTSYEFESTEIRTEFAIRSVIDLARSYYMQNREIVLAEYMIEAPDGVEVVYKHSSYPYIRPDVEPDFYHAETIIVEEDGFNKLRYSNIDHLIYAGTTPWNEDPSKRNPINGYNLINQEGIIVWDDNTYVGQKIYLFYVYAVPNYIKIDTSAMYRMIEYNTEAYALLKTVALTDQTNGSSFNLASVDCYPQTKHLSVKCDKPGFRTEIKDDIITFRRVYDDTKVAVKTGYFYMDGEEYYLFADDTKEVVDKFKNVELSNVDRIEGEMLLNKKSRNYIANSYMDLNNTADVFHVDFTKSRGIQGISRLNAITACNSFNHWNTFGTIMSIVPATYNDVGLRFDPYVNNGYAYLDITEYLMPSSYITMYIRGDIEAHIGKEKKLFGTTFNRSAVMTLEHKLAPSLSEQEMIEARFTPDKDFRYYLIIKGSGIVDDIILRDATISSIFGIHRKNVDYLFPTSKIEERIANDYIRKIFFSDSRGYQSAGAEINKEGRIINSSTIDWGFTKVKSFDTQQSWSRCVFKNVNLNNGIVSSGDTPGTIETEPVYFGDIRTIKTLVFKVNDVMFSNMNGLVTKVMINNAHKGTYGVAATYGDNIGFIKGEYLKPYVKLAVEMPRGKVVNSIEIYVEYKSTESAAPFTFIGSGGSFLTRVIDTNYPGNYKIGSVQIDEVSDLSKILIQARAAKEGYSGEIWTDWKTVTLERVEGNIYAPKLPIEFNSIRFAQFKVTLNGRDEYIKLHHVDLEVI